MELVSINPNASFEKLPEDLLLNKYIHAPLAKNANNPQQNVLAETTFNEQQTTSINATNQYEINSLTEPLCNTEGVFFLVAEPHLSLTNNLNTVNKEPETDYSIQEVLNSASLIVAIKYKECGFIYCHTIKTVI